MAFFYRFHVLASRGFFMCTNILVSCGRSKKNNFTNQNHHVSSTKRGIENMDLPKEYRKNYPAVRENTIPTLYYFLRFRETYYSKESGIK